jgi:aquaporin TIP
VVDDSQRKLVAEFFGTFALIFFGAGSALLGADVVGQALANGLAIGLMVTAVGHISGGHFNPAVTLSMLVTRRIEIAEAVRYWVSQLAGGVAAALILLAIYPDTGSLGSPAVGGPFSTGNALVAEIVGTFFLVFVIYAVAVDKRGAFSILAGLPIGLTISIGVLAVGVVSGAAFNPARWLGPALVSGTWDNFWIWILGPAVGAVLAALVYDRMLLQGTAGE